MRRTILIAAAILIVAAAAPPLAGQVRGLSGLPTGLPELGDPGTSLTNIAPDKGSLPAVIKATVVLENGDLVRFLILEGRSAMFHYGGSSFEITPRRVDTISDTVHFEIADVRFARSTPGMSMAISPSPLSRSFSIQFDGFGTASQSSDLLFSETCCKTCGGTTACNDCVSLPCGCCGCGGDDGCGEVEIQ